MNRAKECEVAWCLWSGEVRVKFGPRQIQPAHAMAPLNQWVPLTGSTSKPRLVSIARPVRLYVCGVDEALGQCSLA